SPLIINRHIIFIIHLDFGMKNRNKKIRRKILDDNYCQLCLTIIVLAFGRFKKMTEYNYSISNNWIIGVSFFIVEVIIIDNYRCPFTKNINYFNPRASSSCTPPVHKIKEHLAFLSKFMYT
ncbi:hypothetical protein ACJX0J_028886, partial [Zea mays]